ncbi:hypothetical protein [Bacillus toyonensis]|uniref:hypothetical protein n=1 Tax=Bacillus toyonensis TaxID=155322 RepID=UPI000BF1264A|nr:hypothetical protein [Bacillus toyonensis]PEL52062.1 hypothetical protein CN638_10725 [Bacillus toyonensis]
MKKVMAIVLGLLIVASGCSSKVYDEQVDSGKKAIEKGEVAIANAEKITKEKADDKIFKSAKEQAVELLAT